MYNVICNGRAVPAAAGMDDYVTKRIRVEALVQALAPPRGER